MITINNAGSPVIKTTSANSFYTGGIDRRRMKQFRKKILGRSACRLRKAIDLISVPTQASDANEAPATGSNNLTTEAQLCGLRCPPCTF